MDLFPLRSPQKTPLITPSASPPPPSVSDFPSSSHSADTAPPFKRQRLTSTSHQAQSVASSSRTTPIDFQKEREASAARLFDVWWQLADRYTRRLDEDDIIDVSSGKIIKDNGVLRKLKKTKFGMIVDATDDDDISEDEDVDELDSFLDKDEDVNTIALAGRPTPRVTTMDPADAQDLRDFLEAEKLRREQCGSEPDDDDDDYHTRNLSGDEDASEEVIELSDSDQSSDVEYDEHTTEQNGPEDVLEADFGNDIKAGNQLTLDHSSNSESSSEDEFGAWEVDEASMVYEVPPKVEGDCDSDSDIEIIENPVPSKPVTLDAQNEQNGRIAITARTCTPGELQPTRQGQLQTPPRSQSSSELSAVGYADDFTSLSASSPPPSSPIFSQREGLLKTSFRSTSSNKTFRGEVPRLDLTKLLSTNITTSGKSVPARATVGTAKKTSQAKNRAEVVIETKKPFGIDQKSRTKSPPSKHCNPHDESLPADPQVRRKGKAKERQSDALSEPRNMLTTYCRGELDDESDDPIVISSSSPPRAVKGNSYEEEKAQRHLPPKQSLPSQRILDANTAQVSPASNDALKETRKRKRVVSISIHDSNHEMVSKDKVRQLVQATPHRATGKVSKAPRSLKDHYCEHNHSEADNVDSHPPPRSQSRPRSISRSRSQPTQKLRQEHELDYSTDASDEESTLSYQESAESSNNLRIPQPFAHPIPNYYPNYPPIPDPRAQYIISQAMHQLSALIGGGSWASTPFNTPVSYTPSHRHRTPSSLYTTPTHHSHPHPYSYNPEFSKATLPPSSPEVPSSPIKAGDNDRRKSLVKRSRSRGRRVSFKLDDTATVSDSDVIDILSRHSDPAADAIKSNQRKRADSLKGKADSEEEQNQPKNSTSGVRGRPPTRGQTPGPKQSTKITPSAPVSKQPKRSRSVGAPGHANTPKYK